MDAPTVADALQQLVSGEDIPKIHHLLKRLKPEEAARQLPGWPYSLLTNLAHADFWQRLWLARIEGTPRPKYEDDWSVPLEGEFAAVRTSFLKNLDRALDIAENWPRDNKMVDDDKALHLLLSLVIHNAYHIGQMKLMARLLQAEPT